MTIKKDIQYFLEEQDFLIPRLNLMDLMLKELENKIDRYIASAWKKTKPKINLHITKSQSGSHRTNFKMKVLIEIPLYALVEGNKWVRISYDDAFNKVLIDVEPPVDIKFLQEFAKRMTDELDISVCERQERF